MLRSGAKRVKVDKAVEVTVTSYSGVSRSFKLLRGSSLIHLMLMYEREVGVPSHVQLLFDEADAANECCEVSRELETDVKLCDEMSFTLFVHADTSVANVFKNFEGFSEGETHLVFDGSRVMSTYKKDDYHEGNCVDPADLMERRTSTRMRLNTMFSTVVTTTFETRSTSMAVGTVSHRIDNLAEDVKYAAVCTKFTIMFPSDEGGIIGRPAFVMLGICWAPDDTNVDPFEQARRHMFPAVDKSLFKCDETYEFFVELFPIRSNAPFAADGGLWDVAYCCLAKTSTDRTRHWTVFRSFIPKLSFVMAIAGHAIVTSEPYSNPFNASLYS